jgi:hypothetical protein
LAIVWHLAHGGPNSRAGLLSYRVGTCT